MREKTVSKSGILNPRVSVAFALCSAVVGLLGILGFPAAAHAQIDCGLPGDSKCELWAATPHEGRYDTVVAIAADPTGSRVFLTGYNNIYEVDGNNITTFAFDAAGGLLWQDTYDGPNSIRDVPGAVAVSPGGGTVVVVGGRDGHYSYSTGNWTTGDYVVVAYDAATGARRWVSSYDGGGYDFGVDAAFAPDGSKLYVTGRSQRAGEWKLDFDFVTLALDATTGEILWETREAAPFEGYDAGYAIHLAVSPDGQHVASAGRWQVDNDPQEYGYGTFVHDATTGNRRWQAILSSGPLTSSWPAELQFSPDSSLLHVTGHLHVVGGPGWDAGTVTYRVEDGERLWMDRLGLSATTGNPDLVVSRQTGAVYVLHAMTTSNPSLDIVVTNYEPLSGNHTWTTRYNDAPYDDATGLSQFDPALAVGPDGRHIYVTGRGNQFGEQVITVAFDTAAGAFKWDARYGVPQDSQVRIQSTPAIATGGSLIFVARSITDRVSSQQEGANFFIAGYEETLPGPLRISAVSRGDIGFVLSGEGRPLSAITIEASPDLVAPFTPIGATTSDQSGEFQYEDIAAGTLSKRFYRASYP